VGTAAVVTTGASGLRAFHGDPALKEKYLERVRAHRAADELIKGTGWANGKGCAVGCTLHRYSHAAYESELGIPRVLAHLEDRLFESMPNAKAMEWPEQFLAAIKPGADLSLVWPQFAVWMLTDPQYGVLQYATTEQTRKSIGAVADLYAREATGETVPETEWRAAAAAADAAADAAYRAADAAADAAYRAAAAAADAAYRAAAAWDSAYEARALVFSEKLLELLKAAE
jgi:hypothetical protein